jgi:NAD-dependent DNA ligase
MCDMINMSIKLDGISILLIIKDDNIFLYTRGNGIEGRDISYIHKYINLGNISPINI